MGSKLERAEDLQWMMLVQEDTLQYRQHFLPCIRKIPAYLSEVLANGYLKW